MKLIRDVTLTRRVKIKRLYYLLEQPENFETFCRLILPHAFTKPFSYFHNEIIEEFMKDEDSTVAAPRGHGKSTLIGLGYVLWLIAYKKKKYIVYTSENHEKSVQFILPIVSEIKNNKMYNFIYHDNIKAGKDDETGKDREDCFDIGSKLRIQASSFETNMRGLKWYSQRPDLIILDDIENDERVINPILRKKDSNKLNKVVIPALDFEVGRYKYIGTILHHESLLQQKLRARNGKIYRACDLDKEGFVIESTILFPDIFSKEKLEARRREIGSTEFECEYRNNPIDNVASLIKKEWMIKCCDENLSYGEDGKYDIKVQGVDFAFSDRITADKSAFVGIGKTEETYTVFQCFTKKGMSITEQFDYIEYLSGINNYDDNALEENSIRSMSKELKNYNFPYTLFWTGAADSAKRRTYEVEFDDKRHTIGKTSMIKRLATQFENGRIKLPFRTERDKEITNQVMDECSTYALQDGKLVEVGLHGDIPIALGYAIERCEMEVFEFVGGMLE